MHVHNIQSFSSCPFRRQENMGKSSEALPLLQQKSSARWNVCRVAANIVFALLFFYIQALYKYDGTCTETLFGLLVCGSSAISWNVYICTKPSRYNVERLANPRHSQQPAETKWKEKKKHIQMSQCLILPSGCFQFKLSSVWWLAERMKPSLELLFSPSYEADVIYCRRVT